MVDAVYGNIHCNAAQMSSTPGIVPDVGMLRLPVSAMGRVPTKANLRLSDGNGGTVVIKDVYALSGTQQVLPGGNEISIQIADKRHLWQWAWLGPELIKWNHPNADGTANEEMALNALLGTCFECFPGSAGFVQHNIPRAWPPVTWEAGSAAQAAQDLCSDFALAISLDPAGRIHVSPAYTLDPAWPRGPYKQIEDESAQKQRPEYIVILGARVVNEKTFEGLDPVGMEIDGTVREIDDLSYKPAGGWLTEKVGTFPNVFGGTYNGADYTAEEARELARKCIWKWYMITGVLDKKFLPLLDVRSEVVMADGEPAHGKPYVISENAQWDGTQWKKDAKGHISTGFTLDNRLGIVKFEEPVYGVATEGGDAGGRVAPDIDLRAAYETADFFWDLTVFRGGTSGAFYVHRVAELRQWNIEDIPQNECDLFDYSIDLGWRLKEQFTSPGPQSRVYPRIVNAYALGRVRSVQWSVDTKAGAATVIQKNFDQPGIDGMPTYEEKLARRKRKAQAEDAEHFAELYRSAEESGLKSQGGQF